MKVLFRILSFGFAVVAFVLLVVDGTGMIASRSFGLTTTADVLSRFAEAGTLDRWLAGLGRIHPFISSAVRTMLQVVPALAAATSLALLFWLAGRRSDPELAVRQPAR